jgi:hypothetical protein
MMTVTHAVELVRRIQAGVCMVGQEELLEYIALSLTETEFDEVCEDLLTRDSRPTEVKVDPGVAMLILGMPVLIRKVGT